MNKTELVEAVAERIGDHRTAKVAVDALFDEVLQAVSRGERVAIAGFGIFDAGAGFSPGQAFQDRVSGLTTKERDWDKVAGRVVQAARIAAAVQGIRS